MIGKIVKIIGSKSIPEDYLGWYGEIKEKEYGGKWTIELIPRTDGIGYLRHTALENDFEVV